MRQQPKISILGAGNVGSSLARKFAEAGLVEVVLWNRDRKSLGIALDLLHGGADRVIGTDDYNDTANSDVIVITAGAARGKGISRDELVKVNTEIVTEVAKNAIDYSSDAIVLVVTNPLDAMSYVAWHVSGVSSRRVIGISGTLDTARFKALIARELQISRDGIQAMVIGPHSDHMIPVPRYCSVGGVPLYDLMDMEAINNIAEQTRRSGAEIIELMHKSAYFAPANSIFEVAEAILFDKPKILPVSAYLANGEYGLYDIFLGTPCRIGKEGVEKVLELKLTSAELALLHQSAQLVRNSVSYFLERV